MLPRSFKTMGKAESKREEVEKLQINYLGEGKMHGAKVGDRLES